MGLGTLGEIVRKYLQHRSRMNPELVDPGTVQIASKYYASSLPLEL